MAMEINGLNTNQAGANKARSDQNVAASKSDAASRSAASPQAPATSTVQISESGQALNRILNQVGKEAPVNQSKVEALKAAIADGSYKPDAQSIAKHMLESDELF